MTTSNEKIDRLLRRSDATKHVVDTHNVPCSPKTSRAGARMAPNAPCAAPPPWDADQLGRDKPVRHLNQIELSRRWSISPRTLERWRWLHQGPQYLKIGGRVVYRLDDVETYETTRSRNASTAAKGQAR